MKLPRLRIRTMMILIGLSALFLAMRRRSADMHERAEDYACITIYNGGGIILPNGDFYHGDPDGPARDRWAMRMARKYWRISDYPWLHDRPELPPKLALSHLNASLEPRKRTTLSHHSLRIGSRPPKWTFLWTGWR